MRFILPLALLGLFGYCVLTGITMEQFARTTGRAIYTFYSAVQGK